MNTKGQAALEFLMTYGWAILIVIAVVAALYAMGVFQLPSGGLSKCSPCFGSGSGIAYVDHNANSLVVRVGPSSINNVQAIVAGTAGVSTAGGPFATGANVAIAPPAANGFAGDVSVTIQYLDVGSTLYHNQTITIHGG